MFFLYKYKTGILLVYVLVLHIYFFTPTYEVTITSNSHLLPKHVKDDLVLAHFKSIFEVASPKELEKTIELFLEDYDGTLMVVRDLKSDSYTYAILATVYGIIVPWILTATPPGFGLNENVVSYYITVFIGKTILLSLYFPLLVFVGGAQYIIFDAETFYNFIIEAYTRGPRGHFFAVEYMKIFISYYDKVTLITYDGPKGLFTQLTWINTHMPGLLRK